MAQGWRRASEVEGLGGKEWIQVEGVNVIREGRKCRCLLGVQDWLGERGEEREKERKYIFPTCKSEGREAR